MTETIQTMYLRLAIRKTRDGYRLSRCRTRHAVPHSRGTWVSQFTWPFPMDGLTEEEVKDVVSTYSEKARQAYEDQLEEIEQISDSWTHDEPQGWVKEKRRKIIANYGHVRGGQIIRDKGLHLA